MAYAEIGASAIAEGAIAESYNVVEFVNNKGLGAAGNHSKAIYRPVHVEKTKEEKPKRTKPEKKPKRVQKAVEVKSRVYVLPELTDRTLEAQVEKEARQYVSIQEHLERERLAKQRELEALLQKQIELDLIEAEKERVRIALIEAELERQRQIQLELEEEFFIRLLMQVA